MTIPVVVGEMATAKKMMKLASMKMNSLYQGQENFTASVFLKPVNKDTSTKNSPNIDNNESYNSNAEKKELAVSDDAHQVVAVDESLSDEHVKKLKDHINLPENCKLAPAELVKWSHNCWSW